MPPEDIEYNIKFSEAQFLNLKLENFFLGRCEDKNEEMWQLMGVILLKLKSNFIIYLCSYVCVYVGLCMCVYACAHRRQKGAPEPLELDLW